MDTSEQQQLQRASIRWQFWFAVFATAFLAVTFIWFLPLRFLYEAGVGPSGGDAMHDDAAMEDDHGAAADMGPSPAPPVGVATWFDFFVNEQPANAPIPAEDLEIEHERPMHVIGVRSDMEEFFHIHPLPDPTAPGHLL